MLKVIFIGDVVGPMGCKTVAKFLPTVKKKYDGIDLVVANAENSAVGNGVSVESATYLLKNGCDVLTGGNHSFRNFSIHKFLSNNDSILRPYNLSRSSIGRGYLTIVVKGVSFAVINLMGQAFLDSATSAFEEIKKILPKLETKNILIDFHAEATGEKGALANFLDGKVSVVVGTHTHVQTNDCRILKKGTGFLTDVGMVGAYDSVLGVKPELVIRRIITKLPTKFEFSEQGDFIFNAVYIEIDEKTGLCNKTEPINEKIA